MANKRNYQKELDAKIAGLHGEVPTLLLHSCCAPEFKTYFNAIWKELNENA